MQVKYQLTIAKLPLAKDLDDFQFEGAPTDAALVNDLAATASSPSNATRPFPVGAAMGARTVLELMPRLGL